MLYLQLKSDKMIKNIILLVVLVLASSYFLPWWSTAIVAFLWGLILNPDLKQGALILFFTLFAIWIGVALYLNFNNNALLSQKMAEILKVGSSWVLIFITGIIGGLVGLLPGMAGIFLRKLIS
jgi:hypothetical protein